MKRKLVEHTAQSLADFQALSARWGEKNGNEVFRRALNVARKAAESKTNGGDMTEQKRKSVWEWVAYMLTKVQHGRTAELAEEVRDVMNEDARRISMLECALLALVTQNNHLPHDDGQCTGECHNVRAVLRLDGMTEANATPELMAHAERLRMKNGGAA